MEKNKTPFDVEKVTNFCTDYQSSFLGLFQRISCMKYPIDLKMRTHISKAKISSNKIKIKAKIIYKIRRQDNMKCSVKIFKIYLLVNQINMFPRLNEKKKNSNDAIELRMAKNDNNSIKIIIYNRIFQITIRHKLSR